MKKQATFYFMIGTLFIALLLFNGYFFGGGNKYVGVTYAKEYKVSTDKSALVKKVYVTPGQAVNTGDLLVELTSNDLDIEIAKLQNRINAANADRDTKTTLIDAEIEYIKSERNLKIDAIENDIDELKVSFANKVNMLKSLGEVADSAELQRKIKTLLNKKQLQYQSAQYKINDLSTDHQAEIQTLNTRINLLEQELQILQDQQKQLNKYATFDGVVENVYVKDAEQVAAYSNLLSINPSRPSSVVGYLVGKQVSANIIGSSVKVFRYDNRNTQIEGEIIGLGAVVALPDILQKSTAVKAYGQEVFIQLDQKNEFTVGEKVLIK